MYDSKIYFKYILGRILLEFTAPVATSATVETGLPSRISSKYSTIKDCLAFNLDFKNTLASLREGLSVFEIFSHLIEINLNLIYSFSVTLALLYPDGEVDGVKEKKEPYNIVFFLYMIFGK